MEDNKDRIERLQRLVFHYKNLYYNDPESDEMIPDGMFDSLYNDLKELDPNNPAILQVGAKIQ